MSPPLEWSPLLEEGSDVLEELSLDRVRYGGATERRDLLRELVRGDVLEPALLDDPLAALLQLVPPPALDEALAEELAPPAQRLGHEGDAVELEEVEGEEADLVW